MTKTWTSPNFGERADGQKPSMIILHYTGMRTAEEALERLCESAGQVSAHYMIEESGKIHDLVPEGKRAWHAGKSCWAGLTDINAASIGIELVNPGHEFGYRPFPKRQLQKTVALCKIIIEKYSIKPHHILGHSDVAPGRKVDPGHLFPWQALAEQGIGLWPQVTAMDRDAATDLQNDTASFHAMLCGYGYDPDEEFDDVITAFHRHFCPDKFRNWDDRPPLDGASAATLLALLRARHELENL